MELIDKYIYEIGKKLPLKSKKEIINELQSLMLDEIESQYGTNPSDQELREYINDYGSPWEVAARYRKEEMIISNAYSELYYLLIKIVVFALSIAFLTIFIINIVTHLDNPNILNNVFKLFGNIISASLSGVGAVTLVFILISRNFEEKEIDIDIPWNAKELDSVHITKDKESKGALAFELILSIIFLSLLNYAPRFIGFLEASFERSTIELGHYINQEVFSSLLLLISVVWVIEIVSIVLKLVVENKYTYLFEIITNILNLGVLIYIIQFDSLYINYQSILGFRAIFVFAFIAGIIDLITNICDYVKYYILEN